MNKKKVFTVIAVLLVALASTSSIIYASQGRDANSDLTAAPSTKETQQEDAEAEEKVRYMFVQSAHSGSFVPVEDEMKDTLKQELEKIVESIKIDPVKGEIKREIPTGVGKKVQVEGEMKYTLSLEGISPQTIAFSDRPERVVEQVPMQKFLDGLCFSPENPPNAALEILEGDEEEDVMVMELFDPIYDAANKTLQYNVSILEMPNHSYAIFNERHDESLPEHFGPAALFIDDCSDGTVCCYRKDDSFAGSYRSGRCGYYFPPGCYACRDNSYYLDKCRDLYGDDVDHYWWNIC